MPSNIDDIKDGDATPGITPPATGQTSVTTKKSAKGRCMTWFKNFDNNKLKPFLIYKYQKASHKKVREYFDMLMKEGKNIEEIYTGVEGGAPVERKSQLMDVVQSVKNQNMRLSSRGSQGWGDQKDIEMDNKKKSDINYPSI